MRHAHRLISERLAELRTCQYGATVAEYAIGAAMVVAACGTVDVPGAFSGTFSTSSSESCAYAPRGTTPRWERPALRCTPNRAG